MIYLDNAATTFHKPECVKEAVVSYLNHPGNPGRGSHESSLNAARIVLDTRMKLCDFFEGDTFEKVIFTSGITESLNFVIQGGLTKGDHVITTWMEHNSVLRPLYRQVETNQIEMTVLDDLKNLEQAIKPNTKMVIVNHAGNVTGQIQDIDAAGACCAKHHILFVVDAAQSAGLLPVSMKKSYIDILCFTGHKELLGIQGIGGLILKQDVDLEPLKVGGSGIQSFLKTQPSEYPTRLEAGTLNVPGIVSLNASLKYIQSVGLDKIYAHVSTLRQKLVNGLKQIKGLHILQEEGHDYVGIVGVACENPSRVCDRLSYEYGIETRCGAHCAPLVLEHYGLKSTARFSISYHNTVEEIQKTIEAMRFIMETE